MASGAGAEAPGVDAGLGRALLALGPVVHRDVVQARLEPGEVPVGSGPEAHLGERHDALQLILGDLDAVDLEHAGEVVAQVGGDRLLEPGELAGARRYRVDRAREGAPLGLGVGLGEQHDAEVQDHDHDHAHDHPPPRVAEQGSGHRPEGIGALCCHGIGPRAP